MFKEDVIELEYQLGPEPSQYGDRFNQVHLPKNVPLRTRKSYA
jgi:hypothetical protein